MMGLSKETVRLGMTVTMNECPDRYENENTGKVVGAGEDAFTVVMDRYKTRVFFGYDNSWDASGMFKLEHTSQEKGTDPAGEIHQFIEAVRRMETHPRKGEILAELSDHIQTARDANQETRKYLLLSLKDHLLST